MSQLLANEHTLTFVKQYLHTKIFSISDQLLSQQTADSNNSVSGSNDAGGDGSGSSSSSSSTSSASTSPTSSVFPLTSTNTSEHTASALTQLCAACDPAPFGLDQQTIHDPTVRTALQLSNNRFAVNFHPAESSSYPISLRS